MSEAKQELAALMFTDIVGSVALQNKLGTETYTRFVQRHDEIFKSCIIHAPSGRILNETGDGFLVRFDTPTEAVNTALRLQAALHDEVCEGEKMQLCIGLNLGAVTEMVESVRGEKRAVGMAINLAARVMDLAEGNQILMTRAVFDDARQFVREHPNQGDMPESAILQWPAHGRYIFKGNDDPIEIYEVGAEGMALLSPPEGGGKAKRAVAADEEATLGWRPGAGIAIPRMEDWVVEKKLGEGGFGEVWLAKHQTSKDERVFKFCFDPERLRSFRRELTLFRLLRDALGKRDDIAALYDVSIEMPPFYLESEYVPDGNLVQWIDSEGGMDSVPMETRMDLMARTARAVDAAHSVGIVHKDIKPSNILVALNKGQPRPRLADFGIGAVTDSSALNDFGITQAGFTQSIVADSESGHSSMTQLYAPPEYLVGGQAAPKGDIYSLGVMLYQLAAGDLKRPLASGWRRDIADPLLSEIIENCVDIDPARRYDTAGQLAERIETLDERRVQKEELERMAELRAQAKKRRRLIMAGSVVCLGLAVLSIVLGTSFVRQKRATAEADGLRVKARRLSSESDFLLASQHIAQDRRSVGLAFLARSLRSDPSNKMAATKLFATLANNRFSEPIYPPLQAYEGDGLGRMFLFNIGSNWEQVVAQDSDGMLALFDVATTDKKGESFDHKGEFPRGARIVANDTRLLAVVTEEGVELRQAASRLKLWDLSTRRLIRQEPQGDDSLRHISMAEDGSHWIVAKMLEDDVSYELQYWDLTDVDNWKVRQLPHPKGVGIEFVEFVPRAGRFACIARMADAKRHVCVLDVNGVDPAEWLSAEWQDVETLKSWESTSFKPPAVLARNGSRLAVPEVSGTTKVFDLESRTLTQAIEKKNGVIVGLNLSSTGDKAAVGYFESGMSSGVVWDLIEGVQLPLEPTHWGAISALAFSPDGSCLVTGSMDGTARLWDIESGRALTERLGPHNGWVVVAEFTEDGSKAVTMSIKGTLAFWQRGGSTSLPTPLTAADPKLAFWSVSPDGSWMSANRRQEVIVRRLGEDDEIIVEVDSPIIATKPAANDLLFVQRIPNILERIDLKTEARGTFRTQEFNAIFVGDVSDDGKVLITGNRNKSTEVLVYRLDSEDPEPIRLEHPQHIMMSSLSGDGKRAVAAGIGQTFFWDLTQENPTLRQLGGAGAGFTFSHQLNRDGTKVVTGSVDGGVRLWDFASGERLNRDFELPGQVVSVAFGPDERLVAGLAVDQQGSRQFANVSVWDLKTEEMVMKPVRLARSRVVETEGLALSYQTLPQVRFTADGSQLVAIWQNGLSVVDVAPSIDGSVPDWVPELAEAISGNRLVGGKVTAIPPDQAVTVPSGDGKLETWGNWLLQDSATRSISPRSNWKLREFGDYLATTENVDLKDLLQISPTDPRALAGLALRYCVTEPQRAKQLLSMTLEQLDTAEHSSDVLTKAYRQLAEVAVQLSTPERAMELADLAINNSADNLESRFVLARALDQLGTEPATHLAALLFETMRPIGWDDVRSSLDRGFEPGATWNFQDTGEPRAGEWVQQGYDDSTWKSGNGPFGFGDEEKRKATYVYSGPDKNNRPITTYFRKAVQVDDLKNVGELEFRFQFDDGIVIYSNGIEVHRDNLPGGEITYDTTADSSLNGDAETRWRTFALEQNNFTVGENIIAVEIHQRGPTSSDLWFELELFTNPSIGRDLLLGDAAAVDLLLEQVPELPADRKAEIRAIVADDTEVAGSFTTLARAVRAYSQKDTEKPAQLLDQIPATPEGETESAPAKAKNALLEYFAPERNAQ